MRVSLMAAFVVMAAALDVSAQRATSPADSAWDAGDRNLARRMYANEVAQRPTNSRATFRLAALTVDRHHALTLYQRYTQLEPDDAWGWMATGDHLARMGRIRDALAMYDRGARLRPGERDVVIGGARVLSRGGRADAAAAEYERRTAADPNDVEAWEGAGREWMRAGRPRHAIRGLERAVALGSATAAAQLRRARSAAAPDFEPSLAYSGDSDDNRLIRFGLHASGVVFDGARLGVVGLTSRIGDPATDRSIQEGYLTLSARPRITTQITVRAGAARLDRVTSTPWVTPAVEMRLRWRDSPRGTIIELRGQRVPLGATPLLVENLAMRNEAGASLDVPLGPFRLRAGGRAGTIRTVSQANSRWQARGAVAVPLAGAGEVSLQYHRLHFAQSSTSGYFAPDQVEMVEAGTAAEFNAGAVSVAMDLGAGAQRVKQFGATVGPWALALRGWGSLAVPIARTAAVLLEAEAYDAPFAAAGVATTANWKYISISMGLRIALR